MEIFSGKSPTNDISADDLTLQEFVGAAYPDRTEVVSNTMLLVTTQIHGTNHSRVSVQDCLVSAIRVGLRCTRATPYERINMANAAA